MRIRNKLTSLILCFTLLCSLLCGVELNEQKAEAEIKPAGYLAVYVASYENNMGMEYAQYPSGQYTDTCRTDVLYYAISDDGVNYRGLNNNKPIYYPKGCYQLGSPVIFRNENGSYGLIATINNSSDQIFVASSDDMIFFDDEKIIKLNDKGITVKNPKVEYDSDNALYKVYWEGGDGNSYLSCTSDFTSFDEAESCDYHKDEVSANLPEYANKEEAQILELSQDEYDRINNKYGPVYSVAVHGAENKVINEGDKIDLPEKVNIEYSDGSYESMGVTWDTNNGIDLSNPSAGTYNISGTVNVETYNSPLAKYRADPYIAHNNEDGMYYLTGSNLNENSANGGGAYETIVLRCSDTINGLTDAKEVNIWTEDKNIVMSDNRIDSVTGWYWAPELHYAGGKWHIIALATVKSTVNDEVKNDGWAQCIFTCYGEDLMDSDNWKYDGYIGVTTDNQTVGSFDTTYFEYDNQAYYVTHKNSTIYITTVDQDDLLNPTGPLVLIGGADRAFERNIATNQDIQEGSGVLINDGKIFVTYSCCTVDMHYGVCMYYADIEDNLMDTGSWHKYQTPLLTTADLTTTVKDIVIDGDTVQNGEYKGIFGPGHNNFTVDENGNYIIVFHARDWDDSYPGATGDSKYGLSDPGRHAYVNYVHFGADGFPIFNMNSEQILSSNLRSINMTIEVKQKSEQISDPDVSLAPTITSAPITDNNKTIDASQTGILNSSKQVKSVNDVEVGEKYTIGNIKYKVLDVNKKYVSVYGIKNKKVKKSIVPSVVKIRGEKYKVTHISNNAFYKCNKMKRIVIKSLYISNVGRNAFKGLKKNIKLQIPTKFASTKWVKKLKTRSRVNFAK